MVSEKRGAITWLTLNRFMNEAHESVVALSSVRSILPCSPLTACTG